MAVLFSRPFPFMEWKNPVSSWYARSLHKEYKGERIRKRLDLRPPILVMHSDKSSRHSSKWKPEYAYKDLLRARGKPVRPFDLPVSGPQ